MKYFRKFLLLAVAFLVIIAIVINYGSSTVSQVTDSYVYDLPYSYGKRFKVVQGYGGLFSHFRTAALDFEMPAGTPIYAAREGEVVSYKNDSNIGGPFSTYKGQANFIIIRHSDKSYGCYWHLKQDGVVVKSGFVKKGQLIGFSGNTGFVLRPHLHFSVKKRLDYNPDSFVKTKFMTSIGIIYLERGEYYQKPLK